ncbi:MAG: MOSC domain-containing protein [Tepidiformaceae bacterium]
MATGKIVSINVSRGGVPKLPVDEAQVGPRGLTMDAQADLKHHGSPEQALCLYSLEVIEALQAEGHPIYPGAAGENITTSGIEWGQVVPGVRLRLGADVLIEVTHWATPCNKNAGRFIDGEFTRMGQPLHPGWSRTYARVLEGGRIRAGDPIELLSATAHERVARQQPPTVRWPRDFSR